MLLKSVVVTATPTTYFRVENPLSLGFRKADGSTCRTSTSDSADGSLVRLTFGNNQFYSCKGDSSLLYANLKASFNYVGTMGSASTTLGDFTAVTWPSIADTQSIKLNIFYQKVGAAENPQYYVTNMTVQDVSSLNQAHTIYIEYQELTTTPAMYIPPPPRVHAYLPNDFLYPFYVAS